MFSQVLDSAQYCNLFTHNDKKENPNAVFAAFKVTCVQCNVNKYYKRKYAPSTLLVVL